MIEKKFGTKDWATQINMPLVAIYIVDTWLAYEIATRIEQKQADFYLELAA